MLSSSFEPVRGESLRRGIARPLLIATLSVGGFLALVALLPSLVTASTPLLLVKMGAEIGASVLLLFLLIRAGEPAAALGVRPLRWSSIRSGVLCFFVAALLSLLTMLAFRHFGVEQQRSTLTALASHPIPVLLLLAATAAIAEEIIFRSVAITELQFATGNPWLAGAVSLAVFAIAHASAWGPWQIIFAAVPGLVLTVFFLWKRDLWVCMIAHFLIDAVGLIAASLALAHHQ